MIKNVFYFMLAALFVLEMFTLNKKAIVKLKIYDVTAGQQIITIHILPSRQ